MSDVWDVEDAVAAAASRHVKPVVVSGARWQGEDEEEDIKDNWEDSDNEADDVGEKETDEKAEAEAAKVKKKRSLKNIISEKEEKKRMEAEERRKAAEEARSNLSPEDAFAEKLRQQKLQEEADLLLAKETFGLSNETAGTGSRCGVESMQPSNKEDFDTLRKALVETLTKHERSSFYVIFLDELFRDLCVNMEAEDIKKLGNTLQVLGNEKMKAVKALKGKKKGGKGKATLVLGRATDYEATDDYGANEYDDFM